MSTRPSHVRYMVVLKCQNNGQTSPRKHLRSVWPPGNKCPLGISCLTQFELLILLRLFSKQSGRQLGYPSIKNLLVGIKPFNKPVVGTPAHPSGFGGRSHSSGSRSA